MSKPEERVRMVVRLPRAQVTRLRVLQQALEEKMSRKMTMDDLLEKIIADFLEQ